MTRVVTQLIESTKRGSKERIQKFLKELTLGFSFASCNTFEYKLL